MAIDLTKLIKTKSTGPAREGRALSILFGTTEIAPFSKTGGLGDVAAALPQALAQRGHNVAILSPLYKHLDPEAMRLSRRLQELEVPLKSKSQKKVKAVIWEKDLAHGVKLFFLDYAPLFDRDGLYGYDDGEFMDNAARFAFFSRAMVEFARQFSVPVDVLHCNDWHTALAPVYLKQYYAKELKVATVLTIHNVAYQGNFDADAFEATGLPKKTYFSDNELRFDGGINYLKAGIKHADKITTVSPTYAKEIREREGDAGEGLSEFLDAREEDLSGVLNGADYSIWSPDVDQFIKLRFSEETLNGKRRNKAELQHRFGLRVRPMIPLIGFVGRLTEQKGIDILVPALRKLLSDVESEREGFQFVFLGEGDARYQRTVQKLADEFPNRVGAHFGYSEDLAHQIIASSDLLAMPSRFEPCGLTQIYAMRYGTVPIVHSVGGLADTVVDTDATEDSGTGFVFEKYTKAALRETIKRATDRYRHHRQWRPIMVNAMRQNFSWKESAAEYEATYYAALED